MKIKKTTANWTIELYVDCPHCNTYFDVFTDWAEQEMWSSAEVGESKKIGDSFEITCPECKKEFIVNEVMH